MQKITRTVQVAKTIWPGAERAETARRNNGLIECAIWSLAGLAVALLLIAHNWLPDLAQLTLAQ
jgi:hypothetical protein